MYLVRKVSRWLLSFGVGVMLPLWIIISVLQATVLNQQTVKTWLDKSGTYNNIMDATINPQDTGMFITKDDIKKALIATFPPEYLKAQTENTIGAGFAWLEQRTDTLTFSVPVQDKRTEFSNHLQKIIEPRLAALPQCPAGVTPSFSYPTCLPRNISASELAQRLSRLSEEDGAFLNQPITQESVNKDGTSTSSRSPLPRIFGAIKLAGMILPIVIILSAIGFILLSESKLQGLSTLSKHVFVQGLLMAVLGGAIWYFGGRIDLSVAADPQQAVIATKILNPLIALILPAVGGLFVLYGVGVLVLGLAGWIASSVLRRKHTPMASFSPPGSHLPPPSSPAANPLPPRPPIPPRKMLE